MPLGPGEKGQGVGVLNRKHLLLLLDYDQGEGSHHLCPPGDPSPISGWGAASPLPIFLAQGRQWVSLWC